MTIFTRTPICIAEDTVFYRDLSSVQSKQKHLMSNQGLHDSDVFRVVRDNSDTVATLVVLQDMPIASMQSID